MIDQAASSRGGAPWIGDDPRFTELRAAYRRFVFPVTAAFLLWFLAYVLCSAYARGFMAAKVVGSINVALVFGLLQFVSTFGIALAYGRFAARRLDPLAEALRSTAASRPAASAGHADNQELTESQA
ncbi:DUF485 domain-containing protein [Kitasatospora sp. NPDC058397]|uniref:DUF485 domain-containing protein n=1 Tax=unclassified Kitasatospora TaxID=2633591 RepID=UPI00366897C3